MTLRLPKELHDLLLLVVSENANSLNAEIVNRLDRSIESDLPKGGLNFNTSKTDLIYEAVRHLSRKNDVMAEKLDDIVGELNRLQAERYVEVPNKDKKSVR